MQTRTFTQSGRSKQGRTATVIETKHKEFPHAARFSDGTFYLIKHGTYYRADQLGENTLMEVAVTTKPKAL